MFLIQQGKITPGDGDSNFFENQNFHDYLR